MNIINNRDNSGGNEKKKGKKEKNLTVKPIRLQLEEQSKNSLKKTLKVGIQVCEVSPLETQIAGHGSCDDGLSGMLQHSQGFVLKPVQPPPRGQREVDFYTKITSSAADDDVKMRELTAKFHGVENIKMTDGTKSQFLMLENLTFGLSQPCVMDVKIGKITYGLDASDAKIARESKSYPGTKIPFGFSVLGIISNSEQGYKRLTKAFGRALDHSSLHTILDNFLDVNHKHAAQLARCFLVKLIEVYEFFSVQTSYHVFASSILFAYDYSNLDSIDWATTNPVRISLIDFAHIFPGNGVIDDNYLFGLRNLIKLFETFINGQSIENL